METGYCNKELVTLLWQS